ncbi:MAG: DUF1223 domain-containing protein [Marinovum sp.]|nr:DUF1223 domain-containing protein [Marinovum sp.]
MTKAIFRSLAVSLGLAWLGLSSPAMADDPVVVELYTSQGCSSCPPADELLHQLAARDGVIALALHVDYWDYIGWKDAFAHPEHAIRQRAYARKAGKRMIYTPQMVIGGVDHVVGNKPKEVAKILASHRAKSNPLKVQVELNGRTLRVTAMGSLNGAAEVHIVRYSPKETVRITRGENRGKTLSYANIVQSFETVAVWDRSSALELETRVKGNQPIVVLVQTADHGPILGAAALR